MLITLIVLGEVKGDLADFYGQIADKHLMYGIKKRYLVFATVPISRINSWESWFIFNLRKININQYCSQAQVRRQVYLHTGNTTRIYNNCFYGHNYTIIDLYEYILEWPSA